jgi:uncharacterized protein YukJ
MKNTQPLKGFFGTKEPVDHHFDTAQQDHTKTPENKSMKETNYRPPEYLGLAKGHIHHNLKPPAKIPYRESGFCESEILHEPHDGPGKDSQSNEQDNGKYQLSGHILQLISHFTASIVLIE